MAKDQKTALYGTTGGFTFSSAPQSVNVVSRAPTGQPQSASPSSSSTSRCSLLNRGRLSAQLRDCFCSFQVAAKQMEEHVQTTLRPIDGSEAANMLEHYSNSIANELGVARDDLRRGKWDIDPALHADHDTLCFCLAIWEVTHEIITTSAPSPSRLLQWYNRQYAEEELADWWQKAEQCAEKPESLRAGSEFWQCVYRLALSDCRADVLDLLQRSMEAADQEVARVCDFMRRIPSLQQMDQANASQVEYRQAMREIQDMAQQIMRETPPDHPTRELLQIYAGCSQEAFEKDEDVARKYGRTWIEDLIYAYAWVFPDLRRTELSELLHSVAQRRTSEDIDDVDRVLFTVFTLDIPALLQLLRSLSDKFPTFFVTHLVDVLYFAGRVPTALGDGGEGQIPPRDWHLMEYAKELSSSSRPHIRYAIDYLRAGSSKQATELLQATAKEYCDTAASNEDLEETLVLLGELGLAQLLGIQLCRRHSQELRKKGQLIACLRWACRAEHFSSTPQGSYVSELLDSLADENLDSLLSALSPKEDTEPLDRYPSEFLLSRLAPESFPQLLAPSGRLYFFSQYARCKALRLAGHPSADYAPTLVRMLITGVASPKFADILMEEEILPALRKDRRRSAAGTFQDVVADDKVGELGIIWTSMPPKHGKLVVKEATGWASASGFEPGDEIADINGVRVANIDAAELEQTLKAHGTRPLSLKKKDSPTLGTEDALLLMRYLQCNARDPFKRASGACLRANNAKELHREVGECLSRAILREPGVYSIALSPQLSRTESPNTPAGMGRRGSLAGRRGSSFAATGAPVLNRHASIPGPAVLSSRRASVPAFGLVA